MNIVSEKFFLSKKQSILKYSSDNQMFTEINWRFSRKS